MLRGRRCPPYWLPSLGKSTESCYLLSQCFNGVINVLKAGSSTSPIRLALEAERDIHAYVDNNNGQLHIMQFEVNQFEEAEEERICWHIIDLDSGASLSVNLRDLYLWMYNKLDQQELVHHGASIVFTMLDSHTICLADAASTEALSQWAVTPQHQDPSLGAVRLGSIRFSPHGDMLAVTMHLVPPEGDDAYNEADAEVSAEVHIYDCQSGGLLQTHQLGGLTANRYHLRWSSCLNLLAVFSRHEIDPEVSSALGYVPLGSLCILDPARQEVRTNEESAESFSQSLWDCRWTPDGDLLIVSAHPDRNDFSWHLVMDPHTMASLFTAQVANDTCHSGMSWAVKPASGLQERTISVYLREECTYISYVLKQGGWQASRRLENAPGGCLGGYMIPSGEAVAIFQGQAFSSLSVSHWDVRTGQIRPVVLGHAPASLVGPQQLRRADRMWLLPEFAPFAKAWPPIYTYIHKASKTAPAACELSLNLVDAASHRLLGSWTCQDLRELRSQRPPDTERQPHDRSECWQFCGLRWAPGGKYLAVYDAIGCTQVLSFGVD